MRFRATPIEGAVVVAIEPISDARGFFARTWCREEFRAAGIDMAVVQESLSRNAKAGTLRGMHFAWPPAAEAKLVRCTRGRVYDAIVDLRPASATYLRRFAIELDAAACHALYVPAGVAHGFQTLVDDTDVAYTMSEAYRADLAAGFRFDDPSFALDWPLPVSVVVERDRRYPDFDAPAHEARYMQCWNR